MTSRSRSVTTGLAVAVAIASLAAFGGTARADQDGQFYTWQQTRCYSQRQSSGNWETQGCFIASNDPTAGPAGPAWTGYHLLEAINPMRVEAGSKWVEATAYVTFGWDQNYDLIYWGGRYWAATAGFSRPESNASTVQLYRWDTRTWVREDQPANRIDLFFTPPQPPRP